MVLSGLYVHLPFKRTRYGANPVDLLKALERNLPMPETDFFRALLNIFATLHDPHTCFLLPKPYNLAMAFLPFQAAAVYESQPEGDWVPEPVFLVTEVARELAVELEDIGFQPGTRITHWNGMPMAAVVHQLALRENGANPDACFAKAMENLTLRPLSRMLIPDAPATLLRFDPPKKSVAHKGSEVLFEWSIREKVKEGLEDKLAPRLFERHDPEEAGWESWDEEPIGLVAYQILELAHPTAAESVAVGVIRIHSFQAEDPLGFVKQFRALLGKIRERAPLALILDVRGNLGGIIPAAEGILQFFTASSITPASFQFLNSPVLQDIVHQTPRELDRLDDFGLETDTGTVFSRAAPLTKAEDANAIGQVYYGRVALITDALCYSAADIFTAGFQDHRIGPVIGVDGSTGGGGANSWDYNSFVAGKTTGEGWTFPDLQDGANMKFSIRHSLRTGRFQGKILEDFGVKPDYRYFSTEGDLAGCAIGLYEFAFSKLLWGSGLKEISVDLAVTRLQDFDAEDFRLVLDCETGGVTHAEVLVNDHIVSLRDLRDDGDRWTEEEQLKWWMKELDTVEVRCFNILPAGHFPFYSEAELLSMEDADKSMLHRVACRKFKNLLDPMRQNATPVLRESSGAAESRHRLLYYVSGNSRKNALDCIAIADELRAVFPGVEILFVSHGTGAITLRAGGLDVIDLGLPDRPALFAVQDKFASELTNLWKESPPALVVSHGESRLAQLIGDSTPQLDWPCPFVLIVNDISGLGPHQHHETLVLGKADLDPSRGIRPVGPIVRTFHSPLSATPESKKKFERMNRARTELGLDHNELIISVIVEPGVRTELVAPLFTLVKDAFDRIDPGTSFLQQYRPGINGKQLLWDPAAKVKDGPFFDAIDYPRVMAASDLVITKGDSCIITELRLIGTPYLLISHSGQTPDLYFETSFDDHRLLRYAGLDAESLSVEITDRLVEGRHVRPKILPEEFQNAARNAANRLKEILLSLDQSTPK